MKAIRLTQHDFHNMENTNPDSCKELGIFVDEPGNTAYKKVGDFLRTLQFTPYIGYDYEVYPKFKTKKIELL